MYIVTVEKKKPQTLKSLNMAITYASIVIGANWKLARLVSIEKGELFHEEEIEVGGDTAKIFPYKDNNKGLSEELAVEHFIEMALLPLRKGYSDLTIEDGYDSISITAVESHPLFTLAENGEVYTDPMTIEESLTERLRLINCMLSTMTKTQKGLQNLDMIVNGKEIRHQSDEDVDMTVGRLKEFLHMGSFKSMDTIKVIGVDSCEERNLKFVITAV